eukprot:jgi/Tetstr1/443456/TSEL_031467.t1
MSDRLSTSVRLVGAAPPAGTSWISHSLRKGAASAANAIGVPLSHIRYQGGWATNSDVVLDYIDPNVLPSPGAWFFFGHIAPLRHFQVQEDSAALADRHIHDLQVHSRLGKKHAHPRKMQGESRMITLAAEMPIDEPTDSTVTSVKHTGGHLCSRRQTHRGMGASMSTSRNGAHSWRPVMP